MKRKNYLKNQSIFKISFGYRICYVIKNCEGGPNFNFAVYNQILKKHAISSGIRVKFKLNEVKEKKNQYVLKNAFPSYVKISFYWFYHIYFHINGQYIDWYVSTRVEDDCLRCLIVCVCEATLYLSRCAPRAVSAA